MRLFLLALLSWLALPVYVFQGIGVRLRSLRLGPGAGDPSGTCPGTEPTIRLLVIGDSSAGAVGIARQEDGLGPQLAQALAARTGRRVDYRAAGFNSAVAGDLGRHVVPNLPADDWTHILLAVGVNDTKNFHRVKRWKREFGGLLYALRARFPGARIVWSPVPPMDASPVMPRLLGAILEIRALLINRKGRQLCTERGAIAAPRLADVSPDGFCRDGFHASEADYRGWSEHLVGTVIGQDVDGSENAAESILEGSSGEVAPQAG